MKLYKGNDFFLDHPVITISCVFILVIMVCIGCELIMHNCNLDRIKYQKEMDIIETEEKARICQETGYCDSKNIDIKYDSKEKGVLL